MDIMCTRKRFQKYIISKHLFLFFTRGTRLSVVDFHYRVPFVRYLESPRIRPIANFLLLRHLISYFIDVSSDGFLLSDKTTIRSVLTHTIGIKNQTRKKKHPRLDGLIECLSFYRTQLIVIITFS